MKPNLYFITSIFFLTSCIANKKVQAPASNEGYIITAIGSNTKGDTESSLVKVVLKDKKTSQAIAGGIICIDNVCFLSTDSSGAILFIKKKHITLIVKCVGFETKTINHLKLDLSKDYSITCLMSEMNESLN